MLTNLAIKEITNIYSYSPYGKSESHHGSQKVWCFIELVSDFHFDVNYFLASIEAYVMIPCFKIIMLDIFGSF